MSHQASPVLPPAGSTTPELPEQQSELWKVQSNNVDELMRRLQFWSFLCAGALIAVTYRLWLPPGWSTFPQIPASQLLVNAPVWCDYTALVGLVASLMLATQNAFGPLRSSGRFARLHPIFLVAILVFGTALILLNQHRLQAWFYQLLIYCVVFLLSSYDNQLRWLRRVVLSIYVYSALGKLDFEFTHTTGQELLGATFSSLGLKLDDWSKIDRITLALSLPLTELLLAIALGWSLLKPRSDRSQGMWKRQIRTIPGLLTCLFHLLLGGLMLWQLQHSWGVVLWNLQFAIQAILLFVLPELWPNAPQSELTLNAIPTPALNSGLVFLLLATMVMPAVERLGYWDHWPSWALYAPHSSRVSVSVAPFAVMQLPQDLQAILAEPTAEDSEIPIPLGQWSLSSLGVPVYPQSRFQLGVARHLASNLKSRYAISAELLSAANRFTGERQSQILRSSDQLQRAGDQFWLNSQPRRSAQNNLPEDASTTAD